MRKVAVKYALLLALQIAALSAMCACRAADPAPEPATEAYSVLLAGYQSGEHQAGATLISNAEEWQSYWKRHAGWRIPAAPLPVVDFGAQRVIAICAGDRPTSGWTIEARSVKEFNGELRVQAELRAPAADALLPQVVTQPYQILLVARALAPGEKVVLQLAQR